MNFWVLFCAIALNLLFGRFFRPYTSWIISLNTRIANFFGKKTYKVGNLWGKIITIAGFIIIWAAIDVLIMVMQYQSQVYNYIAYGLTTFFFVQCGQIVSAMGKFKGQQNNQTYLRQLFGNIFVKDSEKIEPARYNKSYVAAYTELIARRIVMPIILIVFVGVGATVAYMFVDTISVSDRNVSSHSFTNCAVKFANIISLPGYAAMSLFIRIISWITGRQKKCAKMPVVQRCAERINIFFGEKDFSDETVFLSKVLTYSVMLVTVLFVFAIFIFIETTLAAVGLDEYWDFWSGKNIIKD